MYDFLISEYVHRMEKNDIIDFALKQGIELGDNEVDIIYDYIKKHWRTFLHGNPRGYLDEIKNQVKPQTYNKIEQLYIQFRQKIR